MKTINYWASFILLLVLLNWVDSYNQFEENYYPQPIDHFGGGNLSSTSFGQRYFLDRTHWAGPGSKAPLLVYIEGEIEVDQALGEVTTINTISPLVNALVLYIEHRIYGKSIPFGNIDIALADPEARGCLTSEQALVDFAEIIQSIKKRFLKKNAPTIVFGCSYAGMLAAWFRLKFPHIADGAVASSAPVFYFDMSRAWENKYCEIVSNDFKVANRECYERIYKSWQIIDTFGSQRATGHAYLSNMFNTCRPLLSVEELKSALFTVFSYHAQYNGRYNDLINGVCDEIVRAPNNDLLGGIARSVTNNGSLCFDLDLFLDFNTSSNLMSFNTIKAWSWQTCSEFIMRVGCGNDTMFQPQPFNLTKKIESCTSTYDIPPRLNWVSTYFGGYDMQSTLRHFGSNIIFSNGLMDPYSPFGVLEDMSKTVVALTTKKGSHCLDFSKVLNDDPKWLKQQRKKETKIIIRWINNSNSNNPQIWFLLFGLILAFVLSH